MSKLKRPDYVVVDYFGIKVNGWAYGITNSIKSDFRHHGMRMYSRPLVFFPLREPPFTKNRMHSTLLMSKIVL
jgi:hypothetical protein